MNEYRQRHRELLAKRMSPAERLWSFFIGFFGDGFGIAGILVGIGGAAWNAFLMFLPAGAGGIDPATLTPIRAALYVVGFLLLTYASAKWLLYCHRKLLMAVSGIRETGSVG